MRSLTAGGTTDVGLKPFWLSLAALNLASVIAGIILAQEHDIPAAVGAPVVAAFLWQISFYWTAVFERTRRKIAARLPGARLAAALCVVSVAPYCIYAAPTGVFSLGSAAKLAALCAAVAFLYVVFPPREDKLVRQDAAAAAIIAFPMISGLSPLFENVYQGFDDPLHRLESLCKLMLIPLGLFTFLELRKLPGAGFRLVPQRRDWRPALENFLLGLPFLAAAALGTGYVRWNPRFDDPERLILDAAGKLLGIYMTTALAEEFLFRGVVQNLLARRSGRPLLSQAAAAVLFGAAHLGRGGFPNLPYFVTTVTMGWFCGRAYAQSGSIAPAMIAHPLAVVAQTLFFQ